MRPEECLSRLHANANFKETASFLRHLEGQPCSAPESHFKIAISALKAGLQI